MTSTGRVAVSTITGIELKSVVKSPVFPFTITVTTSHKTWAYRLFDPKKNQVTALFSSGTGPLVERQSKRDWLGCVGGLGSLSVIFLIDESLATFGIVDSDGVVHISETDGQVLTDQGFRLGLRSTTRGATSQLWMSTSDDVARCFLKEQITGFSKFSFTNAASEIGIDLSTVIPTISFGRKTILLLDKDLHLKKVDRDDGAGTLTMTSEELIISPGEPDPKKVRTFPEKASDTIFALVD